MRGFKTASESIATTCPYCGVGCGLIVRTTGTSEVAITGDPHHPANFARLCSKGAALPETLDLAGRLLYPEVSGQRVEWSTALRIVAERFRAVIEQHGPDAVAFYVSGQLLTEDYYVANKLMKGFLGSGNIDTNSRLCMSSAVAGYKRAFGTDTVPCSYTDIELADLIVLTGSNTAWCHPVLFQRISQAKQSRKNAQVVVIDPRRTATCEIADLHLAVKAGTVTNSERRISRQRAFREPPGEAKPDWWIISRGAQHMGFGGAFDYPSAVAMFREHARLSGLDIGGRRQFDVRSLATHA